MSSCFSLCEAVEQSQQQGYTEDFHCQSNALICLKGALVLPPETSRIDRMYRFDVDSDPVADEMLQKLSQR